MPGLAASAEGSHAMPEITIAADRVEVSWDAAKSKWLVRIQAGEEVIRRHAELPKNADVQTLRAAVLTCVQEEGYEAEPNQTMIRR
jgi:hypothetical protein